MKVATLHLAGEVRWRLRVGDPKEVFLTSIRGCRLLNPLIFLEYSSAAQVIASLGDECRVVTRHLGVRLPETEIAIEVLRDRFLYFLRTLRFVSRQASLPTELVAINVGEVETLPPLNFPGASGGHIIIIGRYRWQTAISPQVVQQADSLGLESDIPICHEILLDALHAFERSDYRQAILYAAISVESLATTELETEYSRVLFLELHQLM
jgi:hypothetical protein